MMKLIVKARALPLGVVRTHGGRRMKKIAPGQWVPVKKDRYPHHKTPKPDYYIHSRDPEGKIKLPEEAVLGKFAYAGYNFIIHPKVDWDGPKPKLQRGNLTVTETKSGMAVLKLNDTSAEDIKREALETLERNKEKLDGVIDRAISAYSQDILPTVIEPLPEPMTAEEREAFAERLAEDAYYEDTDAVEDWMERHMFGLSESEANDLISDTYELEDVLRIAISRDMPLDEAVEWNEGLMAVYALANEGLQSEKIRYMSHGPSEVIDPSDIEVWADMQGLDLRDFQTIHDIENEFDADRDNLVEMDEAWSPAAMLWYAIYNEQPPAAVVQMVEEQNEDMAEEIDEQNADMRRVASGLEGTPDYDASRQQHYDLWGDEAVNVLSASPPIGAKVLGGGVNETYRIQFENENGDYIEGVWKPVTGSDDTVHHEVPAGTQHIREAATYIVDQELGINLVPPTILKEIGGVEGSVQEFVPDAYEAPSLDNYPDDVIARAGVLDYVVEHMDRHPGNYMGDGDKLYLIDNGYAFGREEPYIWNTSPFIHGYAGYKKPIPDDVRSRLEHLYMEGWPQLESKLLDIGMDQTSLNRMYTRIEQLTEMRSI